MLCYVYMVLIFTFCLGMIGSKGLLDEDGTMLDVSSRPSVLPAGRIDIRRLVDANIDESSKKDIQCE